MPGRPTSMNKQGLFWWRCCVGIAGAFVCAAAYGLLHASAEKAATLPSSRPGAASAPATPEKYPSDVLREACEKKAREVRNQLDDSFSVVVRPPFVVAGNFQARQVGAYAEQTIAAAARAMWASFFQTKPDKVIVAYLMRDEKSYREWAKKLFDDEDVSYYGYYKPGERALVMNIGTGGGTLVHELTHALIVYDFPDVPTWFNEGLGSLHEQCNLADDHIVGLVNWRLTGLQEAIRAGKLRPLRDMLEDKDFYGKDRGNNYAQARYLCQYMQEKKLLPTFYKYYRENHAGAEAGVKAVEHVSGQKIEDVEKDYIAWVKTLRFPPR